MKTLLIYNAIGDSLKYAILDGDYSDLNGASLSSLYTEEKNIRACELLFDDRGNFLIDFSEDISLVENKNWGKVSIITFIP